MSAIAQASRTRYRAAAQTWLPHVPSRLMALVFWIAIPGFCAYWLFSGVVQFATHIDNVPAGIRGVFTVTSPGYSREGFCVSVGTFTSTDGDLVERNQPGDCSWQKGERHNVVYDSTGGHIIPLPAHWDATATVMGMAGGVCAVGLWGFCLYGSVTRRVRESEGEAVPTG